MEIYVWKCHWKMASIFMRDRLEKTRLVGRRAGLMKTKAEIEAM